MSRREPAPRWMTIVLQVAAAYNIAWGLMAILLPVQLFEWAGMTPPNYPALAQCIGMIVGVYGVGYAIAARDPVTHWPIVLVGLLGKIFGPVGFVWAAANGEFPWIAGLTILTNDLAWWLPFTAILLYAVRELDAERLGESIGSLEHELRHAETDTSVSLWELSFEQPLLLVLVRHHGCTYCREALADVGQQSDRIQAAGLRPVVVQMGSLPQGRQLLKWFGLEHVTLVADPQRRLYRALDLRLGTLSQLAGLSIWWRALVEGVLYRHGVGGMVGHGLQMPGTFVVEEGRITRAHRHRSAAERTDYPNLVCLTDAVVA